MRSSLAAKYWPEYWFTYRVGLLATLQLFMAFAVVGMEIGNALVDLFRGNVYSGFWSFPFMLVATVTTFTSVCGRSTQTKAIVALICQGIAILVVLTAIGFLIAIIASGFTLCLGFQCSQASTSFSSGSSSNSYSLLKQIFVSCELACAILFFLLGIFYIVLFIMCLKKVPKVRPHKRKVPVKGPVTLKLRPGTSSSFNPLSMSSASYSNSSGEQSIRQSSGATALHIEAEQVCPQCEHVSPYRPEGNTVQCPKCGYVSSLVQHAQQVR